MEEPKTKKPILSNSVYNALKKFTTVVLPGLATLYFALTPLWNLPKTESIVGTIAAVNVFLGLLVSISTKSYNQSDTKYDGSVELEETASGGKVFSLVVNGDLDKLDQKSQVLLKINNN